jgi:hypothetical protein
LHFSPLSLTRTTAVTVPTWTIPLAPLIITAIILPGSSFIGHLLGLLAGYALAMKYLDPVIEPSTKAVEFIESKLSRLIDLIPSQIVYIREIQARELRASQFEGLPTTEGNDRLLGA